MRTLLASAHTPEQINVENGPRRVQVAWLDGHHSAYPWWYLRGFCPCAGCQGHGGPYTFHGAQGDSVAPATALGEVLEVGNYALNLTWEDGHRTGIYPFDLLRRLCACVACRQTEPTAPLWGQLDDAQKRNFLAEIDA